MAPLQTTSQTELENWVTAIHSACSAAVARHHHKEDTLRLLKSEIKKLEQKIDMDEKMKKMGEMQLSSVTDSKKKKTILDQVSALRPGSGGVLGSGRTPAAPVLPGDGRWSGADGDRVTREGGGADEAVLGVLGARLREACPPTPRGRVDRGLRRGVRGTGQKPNAPDCCVSASVELMLTVKLVSYQDPLPCSAVLAPVAATANTLKPRPVFRKRLLGGAE